MEQCRAVDTHIDNAEVQNGAVEGLKSSGRRFASLGRGTGRIRIKVNTRVRIRMK
jgi:hypothetical protein